MYYCGVNLAPPSINKRIKTPLNVGNYSLVRYFFLMEGTKWMTFSSPSNVSALEQCREGWSKHRARGFYLFIYF